MISPAQFEDTISDNLPFRQFIDTLFFSRTLFFAGAPPDIVPGGPVNSNDSAEQTITATHPITRRRPASDGLGYSNGCSLSILNSVPNVAAP